MKVTSPKPLSLALTLTIFCTGSAVLGYLPLSYGSILLFLKVELRLGVLPTDWLRASNGAANRTRGCPPVLFRLAFRCSVLAAYLLLAQMLLGVGLQNVVSLVGAIAICALTFYLPFVLHARIFWPEMTRPRLAWYTPEQLTLTLNLILTLTLILTQSKPNPNPNPNQVRAQPALRARRLGLWHLLHHAGHPG